MLRQFGMTNQQTIIPPLLTNHLEKEIWKLQPPKLQGNYLYAYFNGRDSSLSNHPILIRTSKSKKILNISTLGL